jgi:hypothetical protein
MENGTGAAKNSAGSATLFDPTTVDVYTYSTLGC